MKRFSCLIWGSLASLASGCGGASLPAQSPTAIISPLLHRSAIRERDVKRGFAVAEEGSTVVRIYPLNNRRNGPPLCTVPGHLVLGITSDAKGDLYVPNGDGTVAEYAPGCGSRIATWHERQGPPDDVAVFGNTVYVATLGTGEKRGDVAVCMTSTCDGVLKDRSLNLLEGIAVDAQGNVWGTGSGALVVWRGGKMPAHFVKGFSQTDSAGLDFANDGTLISVDLFSATIYTYSCDAKAASCHRLGSWRQMAAGFMGKLDEANSQFQIANNQTGGVDVYAYPGFAYQYSYNNGLNGQYNLVGIAAFPR
jgi:hypothetical protein